jgi:hypothetical protein
MPVFSVLFIVEVFTPLNQVVNFIVELVVLHFFEIHVVKRIIVQLLKLLGHFVIDFNIVVPVVLLSDQFCVFGISVELS